MNTIHLKSPINNIDILESIHSGDRILLSGIIYGCRDTAHRRIIECIKSNKDVPFQINGAIIYYVGPSPTPQGKIIGAAGPTTSYRMDTYMPVLLSKGLKCTIGKGKRTPDVKKCMIKYKAIYLAGIGGAGALMSKSIKESNIIAYDELGPEAVFKFVVDNMPLICINDIYGGDFYER